MGEQTRFKSAHCAEMAHSVKNVNSELCKIKLLDVSDLAKMFHVCVKTIHNWRRKGSLPLKNFSGSNRYYISSLELYTLMISGKLPLVQSFIKEVCYE